VTFFLGTARRMESHSPVKIGRMVLVMVGNDERMEGMIAATGNAGGLTARWILRSLFRTCVLGIRSSSERVPCRRVDILWCLI
jgi:hypothetical protein